jgi:DNA-binding NarL/FixJ family response regulator
VIDERNCYHGQIASTACGKGLLVVTDNAMMVGAIRAGLDTGEAFQLLGYVDPRRASVQAIRDTGADVVLVDEGERPEQAVSLIRAIKDDSEQTTVVLLAIQMDEACLERAFAAGASSAISKAIHPGALATFLDEAMNGHIVHSPANISVNARSSAPAAIARETPAGLSLTEREVMILRLVAAGATNSEIAQRLWITRQTVKFHLANVYRKLGVGNRTEACHYAHVSGIMAGAAPGDAIGAQSAEDYPSLRQQYARG